MFISPPAVYMFNPCSPTPVSVWECVCSGAVTSALYTPTTAPVSVSVTSQKESVSNLFFQTASQVCMYIFRAVHSFYEKFFFPCMILTHRPCMILMSQVLYTVCTGKEDSKALTVVVCINTTAVVHWLVLVHVYKFCIMLSAVL